MDVVRDVRGVGGWAGWRLIACESVAWYASIRSSILCIMVATCTARKHERRWRWQVGWSGGRAGASPARWRCGRA
eukprot:5666738-Prymnesium_polylepis.1